MTKMRFFSTLLALSMLFTLAGCGSSAGGGQPSAGPLPEQEFADLQSEEAASMPEQQTVHEEVTTEEKPQSDEAVPTAMHLAETPNVLVVYFSCTGTTRPLAEYAADSLNAELYEILPEVPYTDADLNYGDSNSRSSLEQNDAASRPAISGDVENMEQYDIVFLAYPIWWGEAPRIINTFLESYDFSGKIIVPFCTSGSSGIGPSAANLHDFTDDATWLSGSRFDGETARADMVAWINGLGLDITAA